MKKELKNNIHFYIPERITRILVQKKSILSRNEKLHGGILYFDLVKFTNLTVLLSESGPRGAEMLHDLMTEYYDLMIDIVHRYGGTVYQFAGDSAIVAFEEKKEGGLETIFSMCSCALEMKQSLQNSNLQYKDYKFSAKFSMSFGDFNQVLLGNDATYFQIALLGPAIDRVIQSAAFAGVSEIIIAPEIAEAVKEYADITGDATAYRLEKLSKTVKTTPFISELEIENEKSFLKKCARFMHPVLAKKIETSQAGYFGEFRDVTCVFIQVEGIDFSRKNKSIDFLNDIYIHICELCDVYGGILIQSDFTDKGSVFLILFGAPVALEKKEMMAVRFARRLLEARKQFSFIQNLNIGIAGGPMYCGDVGSTRCKGYSVMGEFINLASRLMEYTTGNFPALDQRTAKALPDTFILEEKTGVELKGIKGSYSVYLVTGEKKTQKEKVDHNALVGRKKELAWFKEMLKEAEINGLTAGIIGEAGVGKSRLVYDFLKEARRVNFEIYTGICYSYEKFTSYFPWKSILIKLFQLNDEIQTHTELEKIEDFLKTLENFETRKSASGAWARVFYRLIGGSVEEISYTMNMDPKKKNEQIFNIIGYIIEQQVRKGKLLLLFEDYHWIDEGSENLIRYILELNTPGLILLLISRTEGRIDRLNSFHKYRPLYLGEFSEDDARAYVAAKMNLVERNQTTIKLEQEVLNKGHGNPFFLESIVYSLREQGVLVSDIDGKNIFSGDDSNIEIPDSIQGVLLSRIDRLGELEKLVLKNASVIGRLFSFSLLKAIAIEEKDTELLFHLAQLETSDFTILETTEPLSYIFKHVLIRDVAYHSLLSATRENLHNRVANYLEGLGEEKIDENIDQLAYHFFHANNPKKSIEYSLKAARKATAAYSIADAIHHYGNVLTLLKETGGRRDFLYDVKIELGHVYRNGGQFANALDIFQESLEMMKNREQLARIHTGIGQVYQEQGDTDLAADELETAMKFLGAKVPKSSSLATLGTVAQLLKRGLYRAIPFLPLKVTGKKAKLLEMRFEVVELLSKLYYFSNVEKFGWANLIQVNIADRIDNDRYKGRSYAALALIYGALGQFSLADKNTRKSEVYARKSHDPMTEAISWMRTATIEMYRNNTDLWYNKLKKSAPFHEKFGETWEKILTLGAMNVPLMYQGKFMDARKNNVKVLELAFSEKIKQFQCWGLLTEGFTNYILNIESADTCVESLLKSREIAEQGKDMSGYTSATRYLLIVLIFENKTEEALKYAKQIFTKLNHMTSIIPHCHSAYYQVLEAMEMGLAKNLINAQEAGKIQKVSLNRLKKLGKKYKYIWGFTLRGEARTFAFKGNLKAAQEKITQAVAWYETTQNEWDRTRTYYNAAVLIPEKRNEYIEKGIALCEKNNYPLDLISFQKLRDLG
jgi:adenylate cyclase